MLERYLLGDWGTTHLRLSLMEMHEVVDVRQGPGIGSLAGPPAEVLQTLINQWLGASRSIDVVLCGMASSRKGLQELPYVKAPASFAAWAQAAQRVERGSLSILLATGMQCGDDEQGFDVMRGEEAQIFGALQVEPALGSGAHCCVLPGTHSKWVEVEEGSVRHFRTALTGELYALLRDHSTLLQVGIGRENHDEFDLSFAAGAQRSLQVNDSLLAAIFTARTAQLLQARSPAWASGYLSGLLIGYEVASMSQRFAPVQAITLIGQPQLTSLYQRILTTRGIATRILDGAACVMAGLRQLRAQHLSIPQKAK